MILYGPDDKPIERSQSSLTRMLNEAVESTARSRYPSMLEEMARQDEIARILKFRQVNGLPIVIRGTGK